MEKIKKLGTYEGRQYTGGRKKSSRNLTYKGKSIYNMHGVRFTQNNRRTLESLVNSANRKAKNLANIEANMQLYAGGEKVPAKVADKLMGRSSDFAFNRKSKSLQQFKTKEDFQNYIKNLRKITKHDYIDKVSKTYQKNYIKAMRKQGLPDDLIREINNLTPEQFRKLSQSEELVRFGYIYDIYQRENVINGIRAGIERIKTDK